MMSTAAGASRRLRREKKTITAMMTLYCHDVHNSSRGDLCEECTFLHDYAMQRISKCPYGENKPACASCPIHCYKQVRRDEIKRVMRYSGPRMLRRHPVLALWHIVDGLRKVVDLRRRRDDLPDPDE